MNTQAMAIPTMRRTLVTKDIFRQALIDACIKLLPQHQWRNPVMFVVYIGSMLTTALFFQAMGGKGEAPSGFILAVTLVVVYRVVREFRRGDSRRPQQGAGRGTARREARRHG